MKVRAYENAVDKAACERRRKIEKKRRLQEYKNYCEARNIPYIKVKK